MHDTSTGWLRPIPPSQEKWFIILGVLACLLYSTIMVALFESALEENHAVEGLQSVFLFSATCGYAVRARWNPFQVEKIVFLTLALLSFSLFLREVDVDQLGNASLWPILQMVLRTLAVLGWLGLALLLWEFRRPLIQSCPPILRATLTYCVLAGLALYGASWFFDKTIFPLPSKTNWFWEETIQLMACYLILLPVWMKISWPTKDQD